MLVVSSTSAGSAKTGAISSLTVMTEVHVAVLPEASVTVSATVCAPTSAHVSEKLAGEKVRGALQLSVEPLFSWAAVTVALPEPSRVAVILRHVAVGGVVS